MISTNLSYSWNMAISCCLFYFCFFFYLSPWLQFLVSKVPNQGLLNCGGVIFVARYANPSCVPPLTEYKEEPNDVLIL